MQQNSEERIAYIDFLIAGKATHDPHADGRDMCKEAQEKPDSSGSQQPLEL